MIPQIPPNQPQPEDPYLRSAPRSQPRTRPRHAQDRSSQAHLAPDPVAPLSRRGVAPLILPRVGRALVVVAASVVGVGGGQRSGLLLVGRAREAEAEAEAEAVACEEEEEEEEEEGRNRGGEGERHAA
ncbi:hypothetical protein GUJ93_ZPchr0012g22045 [Zizania palustris]|uniref:Uncharacterized protein n=1 Tax=Zizania palustris TaxID=103762 RepID=A0A8J6BY35_ZIZPA|nr:hypothetical protein GUJ93_ZPchr0012g22045 [Zizania palustris]